MNTISISSIPENGEIKVFLGSKYNGYIGLVDISLPQLNHERSIVHISCDQVDSTCFNRKRLLRIIHVDNKSGYQCIQFQNIMYYKLDSSDYHLTIRMYNENGPIKLQSPEPVLITLSLQPDTPQRWINM